MAFDCLIVGGGPAGLAAALTLGRARKRVLLVDGGPRRNERATEIHNFVTRDGTPPDEFRRIGREQLLTYPSVEVRDEIVSHIEGEKGAFHAKVGGSEIEARRVLFATGMIDVLPEIPGFAEHWGHSIFQCPYCHGFEVRDRKFAAWISTPEMVDFCLTLKSWTGFVTALTNGAFELTSEQRARLAQGRVEIDERPFSRFVGIAGHLERIGFHAGPPRSIDVVFAKPPQRQVSLVTALGLDLNEMGFVVVDPMKRETSVPGIYAAGDLTTGMQGAIVAAASAVHTAAYLNHELSVERVLAGESP